MNHWEVWVATIPDKGGHEQKGLRPVVIVADMGISVVLIIPFTTNLNVLRIPYTQRVSPSKENGLDKDSILLISQLGAMDIRRLVRKVGVLDRECILKIKRTLKKLLEL